MGFQSYWQSLDADGKRALAKRAKTSVGYLHLIAGGHRKAGLPMVKRLVAASNQELRFEDLRPDWASVHKAS